MDITQLKAAVTREKVRLNFERNYGDKGGVVELMHRANQGETLASIAKHFGLSESRISYIFADLTGKNYTEYTPEKNTPVEVSGEHE